MGQTIKPRLALYGAGRGFLLFYLLWITQLLFQESELTSMYQGNLLGAVVVVKGRATVRKAEKKIAVPFTAVPYYSWNNRDTGQMVVWLKTK